MPSKKKSKVQYTVEPIDIDGNSTPDGDLVTKYVNGKVVSRKFVPHKKMKQIAQEAVSNAATGNPQPSKAPTPRTPGGSRIVYTNMPDVEKTEKPVMVSDKTGFGQYVKAGAGITAGSMLTEAVVGGLAGLFE